MMKTVIPHLRLLTVPVDKLHREHSKYLSKAQLAFLAKRLIFKDEVGAGKVHLCLKTSSRSHPKSETIKLGFIAEDLIKNDWEMIGVLAPKENKVAKGLAINLVAQQHLFIKGIEILTRANNMPKIINGGSSR